MTFTKADIIDYAYGPEYGITYHGVKIHFEQVSYYMAKMDFSHYNVVTDSGAFVCEIVDTWPITKIRAEITAALVQLRLIRPRKRATGGDKSPPDVSEHPHGGTTP